MRVLLWGPLEPGLRLGGGGLASGLEGLGLEFLASRLHQGRGESGDGLIQTHCVCLLFIRIAAPDHATPETVPISINEGSINIARRHCVCNPSHPVISHGRVCEIIGWFVEIGAV